MDEREEKVVLDCISPGAAVMAGEMGWEAYVVVMSYVENE